MFFENNYIIFNNNLNINSISSYKIIMIKFINKYIYLYKDNYNENINLLFNDSVIYSNDIMEILYNIDAI